MGGSAPITRTCVHVLGSVLSLWATPALSVLRLRLYCDRSLVVSCVHTCAPSHIRRTPLAQGHHVPGTAQLGGAHPGLTCSPVPSLPPSPPQTIDFDESSGAVLRIQPLRTPRDENVYECVAQNSVGEITVHAKLTVLRGTHPGHRGSAGLQTLPPSLEPSCTGFFL